MQWVPHGSIDVLVAGELQPDVAGRAALAQVSYAIGVAQPLSVHVDTYGTGTIPDAEILEAILKNFDFRPGARPPVDDFSLHVGSPRGLLLCLRNNREPLHLAACPSPI